MRYLVDSVLGVYFLFFFSFFSCTTGVSDFIVTDNGESNCSIVIPKNATLLIQYAGAELQGYLQQISGVLIPVVEGEIPDNQIVIGKHGVVGHSIPGQITDSLGAEGFLIKQMHQSLTIAARSGRGLLYGVYTFLEDELGCRWYSSSVKKIPAIDKIVLRNVNNRQVPKLKYREVYYYDACDPEFAAKMKLNGNAQRQGKSDANRHVISGGRHAGWGLWCHSFYDLVSPELYNDHPEYFSLVNGSRAKPGESTQLCLSNPQVASLIIESLELKMKDSVVGLPVWAESEAYYWSVSQMDGIGYCECEQCRRLDDRDSSRMGSIISLVNRVAKQFPDKKIATLAYIYSRKAPVFSKVENNVAIQLCAIETAREGINFPIATSAKHGLFRDDLVAWGKITNDIILWDYEIQFQNLVSPFPNFDVMQSNIQFYIENNVSGIFCQGNREKGGEFYALRTYVLSKLLWDPDIDVDEIVNDFMYGYYDGGGKFIKQYFDLMHLELKKSGRSLSMDGEPGEHAEGYLSESLIREYNRMFDQAEAAAKGDEAVWLRVREARMPVMYAQLKLRYGSEDQRRRIARDFIELMEMTNLWMLSEVDWRDDQSGNRDMFRDKMERELDFNL